MEFGLAQTEAGNRLAVLAEPRLPEFEGERSELGGQTLILCAADPTNAAALRAHLTWLRPRPLGLHTSAGMGDRIGLATPGHVRAARAMGGKVAPIFAQQSIREMARTGRTPQQVMDDATWGIFPEGWQEGSAQMPTTSRPPPISMPAWQCWLHLLHHRPRRTRGQPRRDRQPERAARTLPPHCPLRSSLKASGLLGKILRHRRTVSYTSTKRPC